MKSIEERQPSMGAHRFLIRRELGAGGMGVVYEAFDREKATRVALKTLRRVDAEGLERLKKEFRALQGLEHPNLVSLGELLEAEGQWFFTMELIDGCDFLSYVRGAGTRASASPLPAQRMEEARLRSSLRQLACGLVVLHGRSLVHRDIKPSNILVTPDGRTVLMDFGLVTDASAARQTTASHAFGTAAYMAPEQASGAKVSPLSDCYSIGVLLYEALTGRLPFEGSSVKVLMEKLRREATPPRAHVPNVPPDLDELCEALMRRDPKDRPSASDIVRRLGLDDVLASPSQGPGSDSPSISGALSSSGPFAVSGAYAIPSGLFVGRAAELAQLHEAFAGVTDKPIVMLVEGESGMGKTALVEHLVTSLKACERAPVVLSGRCYEREQVPYKAFDGAADALCKVLLQMQPGDLEQVMPPYPALLPQLFPVLQRVDGIARAPSVPPWPDPQAHRTRMFGAFRQLLQRLARRQKLIVVLDDLQWACADSLTLFEEVFGHEDAPPVLVLATLRPVGNDRREAIGKAMAMVACVRTVALAPLPPGQARQLATSLMPGRSRTHVDALVREAGGHPLFVHELARHAPTNELGLSLDAALQARIAELPGPAVTLLEVLCIAGRPITQQVASLAANLDGAVFAKACSVLRTAHLARTDGSRTSDAIEPYHDRVREAFVATLGEPERAVTHGKLARALVSTRGDARAIVRHALAAGTPGRAAAHAEEAALKACAAMAFDQAAEFYAIALAVGAGDPDTQARLRLARAETLKMAGRGREAAEAFALAAEATTAEPAISVQCQIQAVEQWLISGQLAAGFAASSALLAEIREPVAKTPARARSSLLWSRVRLSMSQQRPERSESEIDPETLNRLDVLRAMAMGLCATDLVRSADFNARFLLEARRAGEPMRLVQGLGVEACFLSSQGGRACVRARALLEQMATIVAQRPNDPYFAAYFLGIEGIVRMNEGRLTAAAASMEEAERIYEHLRNRNMLERNAVAMFRIVVLRLGGKHATSRAAMAMMLRDAHRRGDTYFETSLRTYRTHDLLACDQLAHARDYLARASFTDVKQGFHLQHYFALDARGELALYEQNAATALNEFEVTLGDLKRSLLLHVRLLRVLHAWLHARLLLSAAARDASRTADVKTAGRIAGKLSRENLGCATVFALLIRAGQEVLDRRGNGANVVDLLRQAIAAAEEHDMASAAAAARYRLGQVVGGNEGAALVAHSLAWCGREGVVKPERHFEVIAPGFRAP